MTSPNTSNEWNAGKAAFAAFLAGRFRWGTDPKNPHKKGTHEHKEWQAGYDEGLGEFFRN